ncbi:hypothetical protein CDIK_2859 [Cucumispora dikerogammari]|nr:hypothetical protein CDIK_2859 [Cucumispora dikerogammari]
MISLKKNLKNLNNNMFLSCESKYSFIDGRYEAAEVFNQYFSPFILKFITTLSNKKIKKRNQCGEVTEEEIKIYFSILIDMGLKKQHIYKSYSDKKAPYFFCQIISSFMKYFKFSLINSNITCIFEEDYVESERKIVNEPKNISFINKRLKSSHKLKELLSINEYTVPFKGNVHSEFLIHESQTNIESKYICFPIQKTGIFIPSRYVRFYPRLEIQSLVC